MKQQSEPEAPSPMRRRLHNACALAALCAVLLSTAPARAFTEPRTYFQPVQQGGGDGRFFTGSPAEGYGCDVCHDGRSSEHVTLTGLPEQGYVPGADYELRLAWPELAKRQAQLRDRHKGPPSMSLVGELVAESGEGSGVLEIAGGGKAEKGELCAVPAGQQGAQLFLVRPGEPTVESGTRCEANGLGQRCVVAVLSCGVRELRVRWTAPAAWQGAIWFSAGLVATDKVSGDPTGDSVTAISHVILPAASERQRYESRLHGDCAVRRPSPRKAGLAWVSGSLVLAALALRLRRKAAR